MLAKFQIFSFFRYPWQPFDQHTPGQETQLQRVARKYGRNLRIPFS